MTRLGRLPSSAAVVALVPVVFWLWGSCQRAAGARDAAVAAREQALRDSTAWADSLELLRAAADSAARADDLVDSLHSDSLRLIALRYKHRADSGTAVLRSLVADSLHPLVDAIGEACAQAVASIESARALERERVAGCQLRLRDANASVLRWRGLAGSWEGQAATWRRQARPGLLTRVWRGLPWLVAGALVWEVAR